MELNARVYGKPGTLAGETLRAVQGPTTTHDVAARVGTSPRLAYAALARHRSRGLVAVTGYETREASGAPATIWRLTSAGRSHLRRVGGSRD